MGECPTPVRHVQTYLDRPCQSVACVVGCPVLDSEPRKPSLTQSETGVVKFPHIFTSGPSLSIFAHGGGFVGEGVGLQGVASLHEKRLSHEWCWSCYETYRTVAKQPQLLLRYLAKEQSTAQLWMKQLQLKYQKLHNS